MPGRSGRARVVAGILVRIGLTLAALLIAYYLLPTATGQGGDDWPWLLLAIAIFAGVVAVQLWAIVRSEHPTGRAAESVALVIPLFLLMFARYYLSRSLADPAAFSEVLDHNTALYFTVTVFATVGFGDITAQVSSVRMVVTAQMLLNLVVLGLVIRLIAGAAQKGKHKHPGSPEPPLAGPLDPGELDVPKIPPRGDSE